MRSRSLQPERLGQPAAAGLLEEPLGVGAGDVAGDEQDAARRLGVIALEHAVELHAVDARHLQVADDQVVGALLHARDRFLAVRRRDRPTNPASASDSATAAPSAASSSTTSTTAPAPMSAGDRLLRQRRLHRAVADRQRDEERRAGARLGLHRDAAAVLLDDRVGDGQAEARALADFLRREERIEDARLHVLRHARPVVVHFEDDGVAVEVVPAAQDERAAAVGREHRLLGVDDQVEQHLLELVRIGEGERQARRRAPR